VYKHLMPKNFGGHVTLTKPSFLKNIYGIMYGMSLETCASNLKYLALTVLDLFDQFALASVSWVEWVGLNMAPKSHVTVTANQQFGPRWPNSSKYTALVQGWKMASKKT